MIEYPKIDTLYNRDERTHKVISSQLRLPEFALIRQWIITEKIDGTNVRIGFEEGRVQFGGRTDQAQMPMVLVDYLQRTFTPDRLANVFATDTPVTLFGEGYGEKIQRGGHYRSGVAFRLFDAIVGRWWLERESLIDIAAKLEILVVPYLGTLYDFPINTAELKHVLGGTGASRVAHQDNGVGCQAEGIVARTEPMLFTRKGERLIWKLKIRDF